MRLAAALLAAGGGGGDCLAQVAPGPATLVSPEPNFFVLGMKVLRPHGRLALAVAFFFWHGLLQPGPPRYRINSAAL
jgi:hypothetical protein